MHKQTKINFDVKFYRNANFYLANRLSFALGLCGPSFVMDTACSSSAYALDLAFKYMQDGTCDAAIVAGSQLVLNFMTSIEFKRFTNVSLNFKFIKSQMFHMQASNIGS